MKPTIDVRLVNAKIEMVSIGLCRTRKIRRSTKRCSFWQPVKKPMRKDLHSRLNMRLD